MRKDTSNEQAKHKLTLRLMNSPMRKTITAPTLVIHGKSDPLVPVDGGIDTAKHIPGARLELFDGMGHDLPVPLLPKFVALISAHSRLR